MAFKSESQREKFKKLVEEGKVSQEVFDEWNNYTPPKLKRKNKKGTKSLKRATIRTIK